MNEYELKRIVEAVLFVSEKPMTVKEIWQKLFGPSAGARDQNVKSSQANQGQGSDEQTPTSADEAVKDGEASQKKDASLDGQEKSRDGLQESAQDRSQDTLAASASADEDDSAFMDFGVSKDDVYQAICALQSDYAGRGCELQEVASGYRFQVNSDLALWLQRWKAEKPPRYSRAVLETLAIIAYKQPITRAEIEDIRGVAVSTHIVKGLLEREWVRIVGHKEVPGRPALFATTKTFLDYFNVTSLEELPTLAEIKELGVKQSDEQGATDEKTPAPSARSGEAPQLETPASGECDEADLASGQLQRASVVSDGDDTCHEEPVATDSNRGATAQEAGSDVEAAEVNFELKQADNTIKNEVECESNELVATQLTDTEAPDLPVVGGDLQGGSIFDQLDVGTEDASTEQAQADEGKASKELGASLELPDEHAKDANVLIDTQ